MIRILNKKTTFIYLFFLSTLYLIFSHSSNYGSEYYQDAGNQSHSEGQDRIVSITNLEFVLMKNGKPENKKVTVGMGSTKLYVHKNLKSVEKNLYSESSEPILDSILNKFKIPKSDSKKQKIPSDTKEKEHATSKISVSFQNINESVLPRDKNEKFDSLNPAEVFSTAQNDPKSASDWTDMLKIAMNNFLKTARSASEISNYAPGIAIKKQKTLIKKEMENYTEFNGNRNWKKLQILNGGRPIRNIIFTTWRSGSTFLGEVLTSHPATFYHYEPLLHFGIVQARSEKLGNEGLRVIKSLLQCDYSNLQDYINFGKDNDHLHSHNFRLYQHCQIAPKLCLDSKFLSEMCKLFPFQAMKTVRMRLKFAEELIQDKQLDVRILFLVRDPRGTLQSRKHRIWCPHSPDCSKPKHLCSDMVDDYNSAVTLRQKYPEKIMVLRYEDISLNPVSGVKKVLHFFRLGYHPKITKFIQTHTTKNYGGVSSTYRDSKKAPFAWMRFFLNNRKELKEIETECNEALNLWGYTHLNISQKNILAIKDSLPITLVEPPWKDMIIQKDEER